MNRRLILFLPLYSLPLLAAIVGCGTTEKTELAEPLFEAIDSSDVAAIEKLLVLGAPLNAREDLPDWLGDSMGDLPLERAVRRTRNGGAAAVRIVKMLIERGADVRAMDEEGVTLLHLAAETGNRAVVSLLLDLGLEVDARTREKPQKKETGGDSRHHGRRHLPLLSAVGRTPLHEAVSRACYADGGNHNTKVSRAGSRLRLTCDTGAALLLIDRGADANAVDARGNSSLVYAASVDSPEYVALLIEKGADAGAISHDAFRRLIDERLSPAIKRTLISAGASPDDDSLKTAIWRGDLSAVRKLLEGGVDPHGNESMWEKPFHLAVNEGHFDIALALMERGVSVDQKEGGSNTALYLAAKERRLETVRFLLGKGANIWERTERKETALHGAAAGGDIATVKLLIEKGAGVNAVDTDGSTPLHFAVGASRVGVTELLLSSGARVDVKGYLENTPLHVAADVGHKILAGKLLDFGAKLEGRNHWDRTPLGEAVDGAHFETADFLILRGADESALSPELKEKLAARARQLFFPNKEYSR